MTSGQLFCKSPEAVIPYATARRQAAPPVAYRKGCDMQQKDTWLHNEVAMYAMKETKRRQRRGLNIQLFLAHQWDAI